MTMTTNPSQPPSTPVGVEGLVRLLERIRDLLVSLPVDCLGSGTGANGQPYPIRDEVIHGITKALAQQQATGITATELGYALKRATPAQVIEYLEDDVNMRVALSIHFEEQHDQQPAAVDEAQGMVDGWRLVVRYDEFNSEPGVWAEKDDSLVWIAALTGEHNEQS